MKHEKDLKRVLKKAQETIDILEKELMETTQESSLLTFELLEEIEKKTRELERTKRRYQSIFENAPIAIFIIDPETEKIKEVNPAGVELTGYEVKELIDTPFWKIYLRDKDEVSEIIENVKRKGSFKIDKRVIFTKDNRRKYVETIFSYHPYTDFPFVQVIAQDITQRVMMEERLRELSLSDELTGLRNRRAFYIFVEQQIRTIGHIIRGGSGGMLLFFIDIDNFKWINDTFGHEEGDRVLVDLATILKSCFRKSDVIARIGGDEFAVLALGAMKESKDIIIRRLRERIKEFNEKVGRPYKLSISIGVSYYDPYNPCSVEELMRSADKSMYMDKEKRKKEKR